MRKTLFFLVFFFAIYSIALNSVSAQTPTITSFNVSPSSAVSGYPFSLIWTMQDAGGSSLVVPCADGVKTKNQNTGADIVCGSKISSSVAASDGLLLKLTNISGLAKTLSIKLIPKDASGAENESQSKTVSATVSPDPNPIASFTSSVSTTESGKSVTLSWDIPEAVGANIQIECKDGVKSTSPSYTGDIPCGKQIFSTALSKTGTLVLNFTNTTISAVPVEITLFPKISANAYNGINTGILKINIASDYVPDPIVNYFKTSASSLIYSRTAFPISWSTEYTKGVNLKISCADGVTATSSKNPAETVLPCGDFAFTDLLATSSNITLSFKNESSSRKSLTVNLIPSFKNKEGYDATKAKTLSVEVRPSSDQPSNTTPTALQTQTTSLPPASPTQSIIPVAPPPASSAGPPSSKPKITAPSAGGITSAKTEESIPERGKDIPSTLERLFNAPQESNKVKAALESRGTQEKISKLLIETKKLDEIQTIFLNPLDSTYDVSGYRSGKLIFMIPIKVKMNLLVDSSGEIKKTEKPWWSFLVRFK